MAHTNGAVKETQVDRVWPFQASTGLSLPLLDIVVNAGFPSPAEEFIESNTLDLNEKLIKNPSATFLVRVRGDSMVGEGIHDGDILIVDRSLTAKDGSVVIAELYGELTVKRLEERNDRFFLVAATDLQTFKPIEITGLMDFQLWGVVVHVIHSTAK